MPKPRSRRSTAAAGKSGARETAKARVRLARGASSSAAPGVAAKHFFRRNPHVLWPPGNVVSQVYPLKGNKAILGLRYAENAAQWPTGAYADRRAHPLPDLVLLDLKLPRMTGLEVLEWLRKQPSLQRLPVVVLTSSRESSDVNRAYELGANSYPLKPVTFDALARIVSDLDRYWGELNIRPEVERP